MFLWREFVFVKGLTILGFVGSSNMEKANVGKGGGGKLRLCTKHGDILSCKYVFCVSSKQLENNSMAIPSPSQRCPASSYEHKVVTNKSNMWRKSRAERHKCGLFS